MAIGTSDLALGHLGLDDLPGMIAEHVTDVTSLASLNVVEFETHDIGLSTVHARVSSQIFQDAPPLLLYHNLVPDSSFRYVVISVPVIVSPYLRLYALST